MRTSALFLALTFLALFSACSKEKDDNASNKYPYYFKATINGKAIIYQANDEDSRYGNGTSSPSSSIGWDHFDIYEGTTFLDAQDLTRKNISIHLLKYFSDEPTAAQRLAMFQIGNHSFGKSEVSPATTNGASINYIDDQGVEWSTEQGNQTGSIFTITELTDNTNGYSKKIFKATFNCKLYNSNGNSIQVTNAEVRGQVLPN